MCLPMPNIKLELPTPTPSSHHHQPPPVSAFHRHDDHHHPHRLVPSVYMGNCLKPMRRPEASYEEDKAEEAKPLVVSTVHDQVVLSGDNSCQKRKKVRFKEQSDNAAPEAAEPAMRPHRMKKGVRVKVVLTQSELKQILNRATIYHHALPLSPPPLSSSIDQISGQIMVNCRRSRRSSGWCRYRCRCNWNPALHTIPEYGNY